MLGGLVGALGLPWVSWAWPGAGRGAVRVKGGAELLGTCERRDATSFDAVLAGSKVAGSWARLRKVGGIGG